ncbi:MAG: lipid IV(A) 3-deoxy-D-manno-octulosonic acid transferase [Candidatus Azotimanducaceae bacterium WSBS_2022_MAG_OTU7]
MARLFYSAIFYLLIPFVMLRLLKRSLKEPGYRIAIAERFGFFRSKQPGEVVWIHTVSAGETIAAGPLVRRLLNRGNRCLITNMTPTGRERVKVLFGDDVENCYAPYDLPGSIDRFLKNNKPRMLITIDTELWPNMIDGCARNGVPTLLVNGRLSSRSAAGYGRIAPLILPMLQSLTLLAVQTPKHKDRFVSLGTDTSKVYVTGSIKFDAVLAQGYVDRLTRSRGRVAGRPILLGASTHNGEEAALLSLFPALQEQIPDILLVLAPRHTHRCDQVRRACESSGLSVVSFSDSRAVALQDQVFLVDVMGELDALFELALVAFVGGSLVPVGGHNLLEAVRAGTPTVMGGHLDNIEDIAQQFIDSQAIMIVRDSQELQQVVIHLMGNAAASNRLVMAANKVLESNQGALDKVEKLIVERLNHDLNHE